MGLKEITHMVDQRKFDELVENTTRYLTDILKRLAEVEAKVAELEKPKKTTINRARKQENANNE